MVDQDYFSILKGKEDIDEILYPYVTDNLYLYVTFVSLASDGGC